MTIKYHVGGDETLYILSQCVVTCNVWNLIFSLFILHLNAYIYLCIHTYLSQQRSDFGSVSNVLLHLFQEQLWVDHDDQDRYSRCARSQLVSWQGRWRWRSPRHSDRHSRPRTEPRQGACDLGLCGGGKVLLSWQGWQIRAMHLRYRTNRFVIHITCVMCVLFIF